MEQESESRPMTDFNASQATCTDGVWREPAEESADIYPGLVVHDGRVTGSITFGRTRVPLWAPELGFDGAEKDYVVAPEHVAAANDFLHDLLELRGEFARLLLVLAAAERSERYGRRRWWFNTKKHRKLVAAQLRRCLATVDA